LRQHIPSQSATTILSMTLFTPQGMSASAQKVSDLPGPDVIMVHTPTKWHLAETNLLSIDDLAFADARRSALSEGGGVGADGEGSEDERETSEGK
jgi:hypothetical protein